MKNNNIEKWAENFDAMFVEYPRENVEPIFRDPNGDVGPVKAFIRELLEQQRKEIAKEISNIKELDNFPSRPQKAFRDKIIRYLNK